MSEMQLAYRIEGGRPAVGEISCLGAKNFVTKAMVAAILGNGPTTLTNVPGIGDVDITAEMIASVGIAISRPDGRTLTIDPTLLDPAHCEISLPHSGSNRIPILLLGALLQRCARVSVPVLGGCTIGARKVDFHIEALRAFGATVTESSDGYVAERPKRLQGTHIALPFPSVGATETCLFLGVLAKGRSVISNCAIEPEIFELITMLRAMGAIIFTTSGREIRIEGVEELFGTRMQILGDRIEAASWACLACASAGDITVHGIRPDTLGNFLSYFHQVGGGIELRGPSSIRFFRRSELRPTIIETDVYPGFSTDWQQPFAIVLTQAEGISVIHETIFENRFDYFKALDALGARTQLTTACLGGSPCRYRNRSHEHSAIIIGPTPLHACGHLDIPDLRAGLAYIVAAAIANGTSTVTGIHYLERGYGNIVPRLRSLNVEVERVEMGEEVLV